MTVLDLAVTPFLIIIVYFLAYTFRGYFTNKVTRKYFIPGLTVKIIGAIAVGMVYQFYYSGGDTFNYYQNATHIWDAFHDAPLKGLKLIFLANGEHFSDTFEYSSQMYWYRDSASYMVIRVVALLGLFTLGTYSGVAVLFAVLSFTGMWALYNTFLNIYPQLHKQFAIAILFMPTVFFWGSGVFKDTITLGALGFITYACYHLFIIKRQMALNILLLGISVFLIYNIKIYILLSYIPAVTIWIVAANLGRIKNPILKTMALPFFILIASFISYYGAIQIAAKDNRYSISQVANTAQVTATDIAFLTGRNAGSIYVLGELDGTLFGLLTLAPQAVNVSLFRPYLWEVRNPLMLLSATESLVLLILTLRIVVNSKTFRLRKYLFRPVVLFCLIFALIFAFATGVSTFNFGSLSRYRIPMIPFYLIALFIIEYYLQERKEKPVLHSP